MFKKLLIAVGLQAAPAPINKILSAVVLFGVTPVALYFAWKNRDEIARLLGRAVEVAPNHALMQG